MRVIRNTHLEKTTQDGIRVRITIFCLKFLMKAWLVQRMLKGLVQGGGPDVGQPWRGGRKGLLGMERAVCRPSIGRHGERLGVGGRGASDWLCHAGGCGEKADGEEFGVDVEGRVAWRLGSLESPVCNSTRV